MNRKTRKLMWSVPLVAVLAVAGALAIFVALAPNGAQAQEVMVPGPVTDLDAVAKSRTSIELTWDAPSSTSGGTPTGYRIDHSNDNRVWTQLKDNTNSTATRYLVDTEVKADTEKYYRVFAINEAGIGPVSVDPVTAFASVPAAFPPTAPGRPTLRVTLDAKDPYGKINLRWTEASNNGSAVESYRIVEMIDSDSIGSTPRVECEDRLQVTRPDGNDGTENVVLLFINPADATEAGQGHCLLIPEYDDLDDLTAMHAGLTGGESHYYRVTAMNDADPGVGAPSDTRSITTRTPTNPDAPTEPIAVPEAAGGDNYIYLYWLDPVENGGHELDDFQVEVQMRVRDQTLDATGWADWSEWTSLNEAMVGNTFGDYLVSKVVTYDNGTATPATVTLMIGQPSALPTLDYDSDDSITTDLAMSSYNLRIDDAVAGQYKFQIQSKQSGDAVKGLDLESRWVAFNRPSRAGDGYINFPAANIYETEIPLLPSLDAESLDAEEVKDQGIGLTWDPDDTAVDFDHDDDDNTPMISVTPPQPSDYRVDVSEDGIMWTRGQSRTVSLRKWDHEGLMSQDVRFYRLFPINHGHFGEAAIDGARAKKAVIASPDVSLNLEQTGATTTSITMSWDSIAAAAEYAMYWGEPGDNDELPDDWLPTIPPTTELTALTDSAELNPGDTRWYRVVALADDESAVSGADGAEALGQTEDAGEPGTPVGLVAQEAFDSSLTESSDRGVLLLWAEPEDEGKDPHTSYTVEWKSDVETGDIWETLVTDTDNLEDQTALSTHYHHDVELGTDEQRAYQVKALSGSGAGMASNVSYYPPMAVTLNASPMAVGAIAAQTVSAGQSVTVDVSGYFSDADTDDTLTYTATVMPADGSIATADIPTGSSMLTITGVAAGMATVTVTATDAAGAYAMQTIAVTVEAADTTPTAPSGVMASIDATAPDGTDVIVTWTDGANAEAHGVLLFNSDFSLTEHIARGLGGSHTFENVAAGSYIAVVVVLDAQGGLVTDADGDYLYAGAESTVMVQP